MSRPRKFRLLSLPMWEVFEFAFGAMRILRKSGNFCPRSRTAGKPGIRNRRNERKTNHNQRAAPDVTSTERALTERRLIRTGTRWLTLTLYALSAGRHNQHPNTRNLKPETRNYLQEAAHERPLLETPARQTPTLRSSLFLESRIRGHSLQPGAAGTSRHVSPRKPKRLQSRPGTHPRPGQ